MIEKLKVWAKTKLLPWLKKEWMVLVNFLVLAILYAALPTDSGLGVFVGLWIFVQIAVLGYRLFIKKTTTPTA
jgi:hypothetical protein